MRDLTEGTRGGSGLLGLEVVDLEKLQVGLLGLSILCNGFGAHFWLSPWS